MREPIEKIGMAVGVCLALFWPLLLGAALAGKSGVLAGAAIYLLFGAALLLILILGGIRGIIGS